MSKPKTLNLASSTPNPRTKLLSEVSLSRSLVERWVAGMFDQGSWMITLADFVHESQMFVANRVEVAQQVRKLQEDKKHALVDSPRGSSGVVVIPDRDRDSVPDGK